MVVTKRSCPESLHLQGFRDNLLKTDEKVHQTPFSKGGYSRFISGTSSSATVALPLTISNRMSLAVVPANE